MAASFLGGCPEQGCRSRRVPPLGHCSVDPEGVPFLFEVVLVKDADGVEVIYSKVWVEVDLVFSVSHIEQS